MKQILWISPIGVIHNAAGYKGNYANETAKWLVTQYLIWARKKLYHQHSNTSWTWKSQVDTDLETVAKMLYNHTDCKELLR